MLEYFPDPYPDEILYSVWARYNDQVNYPSIEAVFQELFGRKGISATVDLPCHLGYFFDNLPLGHCYTVDKLIDQHTLFPLYGPFLPPERYSQIREQMISGNGQPILLRMGFVGTGVPAPYWLRYCPACVEQDRMNLGECYWHRLHQVPGVEICPVHLTFLENSAVRARTTFTTKEFVSAERAIEPIGPRFAISSPFFQVLNDIATDVVYLLEQHCTPHDAHFFREQYRSLLGQYGLVTPGGFVRVTDLLNAFLEHYPPELLTLLHCEMTQSRLDTNWLAVMAHRSKNIQHPLRHVLVMHFLAIKVETFFRQRVGPSKPFGDGPWPCLNPVCKYYRQMHISSCKISEHNEKTHPLGKFVCECGFMYCRTGPDHSPDDAFRRDRVLAYGLAWETRLRELWFDPTVSLKEIARRLGGVLSTVNFQANKLRLPVPRESPRTARLGTHQKRQKTKDISWYREQWLALVRESPGVSTFGLRRAGSGIYSWLSRRDREWIVAHSPAKRLTRKQKSQVQLISQFRQEKLQSEDEMTLDVRTAEAVRSTADRLIATLDPPERITLRRISREVPQVSRLKRQPDKAPLTCQAVQDVAETPDAFAIRRLWCVVQHYREERSCPTRAAFIQRVRLRSALRFPSVEQALEEAMASLT